MDKHAFVTMTEALSWLREASKYALRKLLVLQINETV